MTPGTERLAGESSLTGDLALDRLARVGIGDKHRRRKRLASRGPGQFRFAGAERWSWRWRSGWCGSASECLRNGQMTCVVGVKVI